ncbi:helix-turn-helix transcriptional regulator [Streptococcus suis]|uniref:Transcriptional regulator, Cro/CI family n=1 Tax=Streptococcus suis D12 TaxID=1004952 RepID=G7SFA8_STRSU|nr:helix-turn-helix transcriptional regulator [Streptococcus suis]AER18816.1 transcriptional regulator, Cro/CI family [Streptococcus suis D12]HEM3539185.1 helix-turn-helix domain-containing protein [Streptococcus suis]HEM3545529.1 helix-turn-helix domain-containing protein [Streptococcus suis]HEM6243607.1 helix-turn-helix domain-containing protein [Streptococcus suis]
MSSTIKNRLKALRNAKGLTQDELVLKLNSQINSGEKPISKMTVSNWENNKHAIKQDKAKLLADFFGVSVPYLLGYEIQSNQRAFLAFEPGLLKSLRLKNGCSLSDISEITNIPIKDLEELENDQLAYSDLELHQLTNFFNVKVDEILGYVPHHTFSIPINISSNMYKDVENITDTETLNSLISDTLLANKLLDNLKDKLLSSEIINSQEYNNEIEKVMAWLIDFNNALGIQKLKLITKNNK